MREFLIIGGFGFSLFLGFLSVPPLRLYFRTGLKGILFMGIGGLLGALGVLAIIMWYISLYPSGSYFETGLIFLFLLLIGSGSSLVILGQIISITRESGAWKEIREKNPLWQRLTGNIAIHKYEKPPPPAMSKRAGLLCGISAITFGSLLIILNILFKIPTFSIHFFVTGTFAIIIGLVLIIFSIVYLNKGQELPE